jgi:hypothetical protein
MSARNVNTIAKARQRVAEQRRWIEQCGGTLWGYIERYGLPGQDNCMGDGGRAIWAADSRELALLEQELAVLEGRS